MREYWFNPPYNKAVYTNIGRKFLELVEKHFPKGSKWHKHFNRHTVKVSYCCTRNMVSHIAGHNHKILRDKGEDNEKPCPSTKRKGREPCPLGGKFEGKCRTEAVVYQALVTSGDKTWNYFGSTKRSFHERWGEHLLDMGERVKRPGTALSAKVWELKDARKPYELKTNIIKKAHVYKTGDSNCDLCLTEKMCIALNYKAPEELFVLPEQCRLLNIRTEIMGGCKHKIDCRLIGRKNATNRES